MRESALLDVLRVPDSVTAYAGLAQPIALTRSQQRWQASGVEVAFEPDSSVMPVFVSSPQHELTHVHLRWAMEVPGRIVSTSSRTPRASI